MKRGIASNGRRQVLTIAVGIAVTLALGGAGCLNPTQRAALDHSAAGRCAAQLNGSNHDPADASETVHVGGPSGVAVPHVFNFGDAYRVEATSADKIDFGFAGLPFPTWQGSWGPDGNPRDLAPGGTGYWPLPGFPKFSLIGAFDQSPPPPHHFAFLGSHSGCEVATKPTGSGVPNGWLHLQTNYDLTTEETGSWTVTVFEFHGSHA
jgi:hypothetical protein